MKDYTSDAPVWSDSIPVVEESDLVNADNDNAAAKQLQQNILVLKEEKVDKEDGKSLVSDTERTEWNAMYQQATGYTDQKIADLINGAPSTLDTLGEIANAMGENADVVEALNAAIGTKANQDEMESLLGTKLDQTGDAKDNTITFGSSDTTTPSAWTDVAVLKSGETLKSFAQKVSTMFKNIRYLWKMMGSTDISSIGNGTVTDAISQLNTDMAGLKTYILDIPPTTDFNTLLEALKNFYKTLKPGPFDIFLQTGSWYRASGIYAGSNYGYMIIYTYDVEGIDIYSMTLFNNSWSKIKQTFL